MKALAIFSGGLDSILASLVIRNTGIDVLAVFFETPFFSSKRARNSAEHINMPIRVIDITDRHLNVVKNPKYGYGGNMNPCIDCHALMFRAAGEMMEKEGADFLVSGEVLGQRPMSQNRQSLSVVEKESGYKGYIVRPLSAGLLPRTIPEEKGWIRREDFLKLSGRSRKPQITMAHNLGITDFPAPAGGCMLTDKIFSNRLKDLFSFNPEFIIKDIELLKLGRHFRISPSAKITVGRDMEENMKIFNLAHNENLIVQTVSVPGPVTLASGKITPEIEKTATELTASYSSGKNEEIEVELIKNGQPERVRVRVRDKSDFSEYLI